MDIEIMVDNLKCLTCGDEFSSLRSSKLCCSIDCERARKSNYDSDRYMIFRNKRRKERRDMLIEKYSIISANILKLDIVCDECLNKFYWDYSQYENFNNTYISSYNSTPFGRPVCPNCGLILENDFTYEQKTNGKSAPKREAIYCGRNKIDFIREAEYIRKKRNTISYIGELTQHDIDLCIIALLRK